MKDKSQLVIMFCFLFIAGLNIISNHKNNILSNENEILKEENQVLQLELVDKENDIFEVTVDLRNTEKALSEVANDLEMIQENEKDILEYTYVGEFKCTSYCCEKYPHICGGGNGITASGQPIQPDVSVAVGDTKTLPYGTVIYIEDVGIRIVQDTGNLGKHQIDVAVDTHEHALNWELQGKHKVWIIKEGGK